MSDSSLLTDERKWLLFQAAADFFFLQNRSYPRGAALELTGNRYGLDAVERMLLSRGLFSQKEALLRRAKRIIGAEWRKKPLFVDGHNVQITIESHIESRPLLKANDGAMRDLAGQSARFRLTETTDMALDMIFRYFDEYLPGEVVFLFDQPMSRSGELAAAYRARLKKAGIRGDARAVAVPEREFPYGRCVVASSDRAVLDCSSEWIDLACRVIEYFGSADSAVDFSGIILSTSFNNLYFTD
ncbi:MAG: DUF434 domain-containing protein [Syntrophobacteraceae bacterium]